jgi:HK97 family phage prohead protease
MEKYDFSGWATRANLKCSDGRVIMKDAFKHNDGQVVPLVWNHRHDEACNVLGHALLENREEGVYAYCTFNDTENGQLAKVLVKHGDISALSIYANQLKQNGSNVMHGMIREVSLVHAGANPEAFIENVMCHSADGEIVESEDEADIFTGELISLYHADEAKTKEDEKVDETKKTEGETEKNEKTVKEIIDSMTDEQKAVMFTMAGLALEHGADEDEENEENEDSEGGNDTMKHNVFDTDTKQEKNVLSHADQASIIALAKTSAVGSLKAAMEIYAEENKDSLAHGFIDGEGNDAIAQLFPDFKDVHPGAPELIERDQSWVGLVMRKAHKSPISRVRTRQADARANELRAKGYNDRTAAKSLSGNIKLLMRTTDPQTVYRRDELHRDDIIDITDFDVVAYQKVVMKHNLEEDIALAALIGDGREDTDPDKIHENHIRSIWNDEELYTIHADIDMAAARQELQGSNTSANFGENYIRAEAFVTGALYAREKYKGKGQVDLFIDPHELNVMLLARDLNGRRIYDSKADLAKALNVGEIHTVEQFAGKTRTTTDGKTKKLLGIFVNMANYQFGSTRGGEITNFEDFDIDFNKYKYLMETRLSGALTEIYSAIALEEPVAAG